MPDFQPTSEVMHLSFLLSSMPFLTDHDFSTSCRIQYLPLKLG
jgi:hypothetical protein